MGHWVESCMEEKKRMMNLFSLLAQLGQTTETNGKNLEFVKKMQYVNIINYLIVKLYLNGLVFCKGLKIVTLKGT